MKSEMKMPRDRDREVKLEKNSRETRLSQVTGTPPVDHLVTIFGSFEDLVNLGLIDDLGLIPLPRSGELP